MTSSFLSEIPATMSRESSEPGEAAAGPPPADGARKLATRVAHALEREIVTGGWRVGLPLGNEDELMRRFEVGRGVMREALAITEQEGLTRRVRGRHGGVLVAAPTEEVVAASLRNYLLYTGLDSRQLITAFRVLERLALPRAAERRRPRDRADLQALVSANPGRTAREVVLHTQRVYRRLIQMTDHPALEVFAVTAVQLLIARGVYLSHGLPGGRAGLAMARAEADVRRRQVEAVLDGDALAAIHLGRELESIWGGVFAQWDADAVRKPAGLSLAAAQRMAREIGNLSSVARPVKRADTIAIQLHHAILRSGLRPGELLASEGELMARHAVSRAVLREAVRSLEGHGFVTTGEGRYGGLRVGCPSPERTVRSALLYLAFLAPEAADLQQLAASLEDAAVELAAAQARRDGGAALAPLRSALAPPAPGCPAPALEALKRAYFRELAAATANPFFEMMMRILGDLYVSSGDDGSAGAATRARWLKAGVEVLDALSAGDARAAVAAHGRVREIGRPARFRRRTVEELLTG